MYQLTLNITDCVTHDSSVRVNTFTVKVNKVAHFLTLSPLNAHTTIQTWLGLACDN